MYTLGRNYAALQLLFILTLLHALGSIEAFSTCLLIPFDLAAILLNQSVLKCIYVLLIQVSPLLEVYLEFPLLCYQFF